MQGRVIASGDRFGARSVRLGFVMILGLPLLFGSQEGRASAQATPSPVVPDSLKTAYGKLATAIRTETMPDFMKFYHLDFIFEARDGSCLDRGPWRRLWLERFDIQDYSKVSLTPEKIIKQEEGETTVRSRGIVVFKKLDDAQLQLQEIVYEDTWMEEEGAWKLLYQVVREIKSQGTLASSRGVGPVSPRLAELAKELETGKRERLASFWQEREKHGPLIESKPTTGTLLTFVWRGTGNEESVSVDGGVPAAESTKPLTRLGGNTDLWYRTERLPPDAVFTYEFRLVTRVRLPGGDQKPTESFSVQSTAKDPLNPNTLDGKSLVRMPRAATPPKATAAEGARGTVDRHSLQSKALDERRVISVYTPPNYEALVAPCRAVLLLARADYQSRKAAQAVLDQLIATKKIPPVVVAIVHAEGSKTTGFRLSAAFGSFVADDLLPWLRQTFRVSKKREHVILGGTLDGASVAAYCALARPELCSAVMAHGGTFERGLEAPSGASTTYGWIARHAATTPKRPLRFRLSVGSFGSHSTLSANRHLRDVLEAKAYSLTYREFPGDHNTESWLEALAEGLVSLLKS